MNKIKIIELLNMISRGEEVPKCFKVNNHTWKWNVNSYQNELYGEFAVTGLRYDLSNLNDEVEIIEEDKKIEKLKIVENGSINSYALLDKNGTKCALTKHSKIIADKINKIIDYINKGD